MSDPEQYHIGIICALTTEYTASQLILDERHRPPSWTHQPDPNTYTLGKINGHNVVIAVLPDGEYGIATAAAVSTHMIHSFPNVKIGLLVGIGGGAPGKEDIRLGDVIVGLPREGGSGVLQYDYGKAVQGEELRLTRYLDQAPFVLRSAAAGLKSRLQQGLRLHDKIEEILSRCKLSEFNKPAVDHLYRSDIIHNGADCVSCEKSGLIARPARADDGPIVHYGLVASADFLIKDAELRDKLAGKHGILCFEMEAAGLVNHFPCLIIRGICDYSDTHKNKKWQGYAALTAAVYAKELLSLIEPNQGQKPQIIKNFSLPFGLPGAPILETFYGRRKDLIKLEEALPGSWKDNEHNRSRKRRCCASSTLGEECAEWSSNTDERNNIRCTVALCGLGGVGKTQTAIEYAKRHSKHYTAILWFDGKDESSLQNSFVISLKRLKMAHPEAIHVSPDIVEPKAAVAAVLEWLNITYNDCWLLIFDNIDEPDILGVTKGLYDIQKYFPSTMHGHIIITTRCTLLRLGKQLLLRKMTDTKDCLDILRTTSMRPNIDKEARIEELLERLDGLPLALATAGSYLSQMPDSIEDYLDLYRNSWLELQEDTVGLPEHQGRTLNVTWQITADRIKAKDASAWQLLELWTCFSNQDLWYELLRAGQENKAEWFKNATKTKSSFGRHMRTLRMYGLVDIQHEPAGYSIHKCLHDWLKATLPDVQRKELFDIALTCVAHSIPGSDLIIILSTADWPLQLRLLPHAEECSARIFDQAQRDTCLEHLGKLARLYYNFSRYKDTTKILEQALNDWDEPSGKDDVNTLRIASSLCRVYCALNRMDDAETLCKRILEIGSRSLGTDNILFLRAMMLLAEIYTIIDKTDEANAVLLSIRSAIPKVTGWIPFDEVRFAFGLAILHQAKHHYVEAKVALKQTLSMSNDLPPSQEGWILYVKEHLSSSCIENGDFDEAKEIIIEVYAARRKQFGDRHSFTLRAANILGFLYIKTGHIDEAEQILSRAYTDAKAEYGGTLYLTLGIGDTWGVALLQKGELTRAETLLTDILADCISVNGPDHLSSLEVAQNLGDVYKAQGRLVKAQNLYDRVYLGFSKKLGVESDLAKGARKRLDEIADFQARGEDTGK